MIPFREVPEAQDFHQTAIHVAARLVVAAVKETQSAAARVPLSNAAREPVVTVAGVVAEMLQQEPTIADEQIKDYLVCDYLFASSSETCRKGVELDNLLEPIQEAMRILVEYKWLHDIVTDRLIEQGSVTQKQLHDTLHGGSEDMRRQRSSTVLSMLVCTLVVLILDGQNNFSRSETVPVAHLPPAATDFPLDIEAVRLQDAFHATDGDRQQVVVQRCGGSREPGDLGDDNAVGH